MNVKISEKSWYIDKKIVIVAWGVWKSDWEQNKGKRKEIILWKDTQKCVHEKVKIRYGRKLAMLDFDFKKFFYNFSFFANAHRAYCVSIGRENVQ